MPLHAKHRLHAVLLLVLLAVAGCSGPEIVNAITPNSGYTRTRDIVYGDHGLKLDVYSPDHAQQAPVVLFFWGGSWQKSRSFDKSAYKFLGQALAEKGYVAMIADYRVYPQVQYPAFLYDCAQAVSWAHAHAADYGGDPAKLVLMGHSAGAYNAVMLALDPEYLHAVGADPGWLRGAVGLAGPYDFLPITDPDLQAVFGPPQQWPQTQPINHVDGRAPPLLLIAGDDDNIVYVKNTNNLYEAIRGRGGRVEKVIYPRMDHFKIIALMSARLPGHAELMQHITDFVNAVTGPQPKGAAPPP
jgi:acetyl esterase/lipase